MNKSDTLLDLIKYNLTRLQAFNILLLQDSELSKEFFINFRGWDPERISHSSQNKNVIYRLCDQIYQNYSESFDSELSISDIVHSVWNDQSIYMDGSIEITDFDNLKAVETEVESKIEPELISPLNEGKNVLIGSHPKWKEMLQFSQRVAKSDFSVMICGETGVGKELIARRVHDLSRRSDSKCVVLNCAAFSKSLIESELFGYEANSFTGADPKGKSGWIGSADGGTLVLDEVADLSPRAQAVLLRAIESGELQRVGGTITKVDFRLISISNKPLGELVSEGKFRQDLFYRLAIVPLNIPPLRERVVDILTLANHFINKFRQSNPSLAAERFSSDSVKKLQSHVWNGNVRELENVVARAMILCEQLDISCKDLVFDQPNHRVTFVDSKKLQDQLTGVNQVGISRLSQEDLVIFLSSSRWFRSRDYAKRFNLSESTSHRHLSVLCEAGILEKSDKQRNRTYRLSKNSNQ